MATLSTGAPASASMTDDIIEIFEQLKIKRDSAVKAYRKRVRCGRNGEPTEQQKERPPAPIYSGPSELDFRIAKQRVKTRQWQFEQRQQMVGKTKSRPARGDFTDTCTGEWAQRP
jgi:hypothetical protein